MAYAGQTIANPVSGERITFRRTAADTGGEVLAFDLELSADGHVPGVHVHPSQEERFEVVSGTMRFRMGLRSIVARAGDIVTVPAGTVHKFANAGDGPAQARVEVRPALRMEDLLTTAVRLAQGGRTNRKACPSRSTSRSSRASSPPRSARRSRPPASCVRSWRRSRGRRRAGGSASATSRAAPGPPRPAGPRSPDRRPKTRPGRR